LWPYDERYGKGILATLAVLIILLVLKRLFSVFPVPDFAQIGIFALVGAGGFFTLLLRLGIEDEDEIILEILRKKLARS
ncbi:MAG: hypothetical protein D6732_25350, partial [Methanobacteriota archaeon]